MDGSGTGNAVREDAGTEAVLRAKYIDFCSAHLTEVFLSLSDERVYELAQKAAVDADLRLGSLGFTAVVRLVTQKLREAIPLPDFAAWREDYARNPGRYEPYLLGLWEELLEPPSGRP